MSRDSRALLIVTLFYLIALLSMPLENLSGLIWFGVYPILGAAILGRSFNRIFLKSTVVLPFVLMIGIFNPVFDQTEMTKIGPWELSHGWITFISITLRGLFAQQALLLLTESCGFIGMCRAMRQLYVPAFLTTQLEMVYRYSGTMLTNGLLMPTSGEVNIGDVPLTRKTLPLIRQSVGMVFQNADDQLFMPTVEEDVAFGPMNMKLPKDEVTRRVLKALEDVGATQLARRQPSTLSGGEKKRAAVATVLSMEPSILVMDEPTSGLDAVGQRQLVDVVKVWDGRTENLLADSETLRHYNLEPLRLAQ